MSIVLDNFVLPDLPQDVLATYPYAVIFRSGFHPYWTGLFEAVLSTEPFVYVDGSTFVDENGTISGKMLWNAKKAAVKYNYNFIDGNWCQVLDEDGTNPVADGASIYDGTYIDLSSTDFVSIVLWTNHTTYVVDDYNLTEGTYTLTAEVFVPSKVISDTTELPSIPANVLKKCPYWVITKSQYYVSLDNGSAMATGGTYNLCASEYPLLHIDILSLDPSVMANVMFPEHVGNMISAEYDPNSEVSEWTNIVEVFSHQSEPVPLMAMSFSTMQMFVRFCRANHKVYEVDLMNSSDKDFVLGELYYNGFGAIDPPEEYGVTRKFLSKMANHARRFGLGGKWLQDDDIYTALDEIDDAAGWMGKLMFNSVQETELTVDDTYIDIRPFRFGQQVTKVICPNATGFGLDVFYDCKNLAQIDAPALVSIYNNAFHGCVALTEVAFSNLSDIHGQAFFGCVGLAKADLGVLSSINEEQHFSGCSALTAVIIRCESMCTLANANTFEGTPIASGNGYIYVPAAIIDTYKSDSVWSAYADQFRAIEDYPDICG